MDIKQDVSISIESTSPQDLSLANELAARLDLQTASTTRPVTPFVLCYRRGRLELQSSTEKKPFKPLWVDFLSGPSYYRFTHDRKISQPLARAVGIKRGYRPTILDANAGLGEDGFVLASLGCDVTMLERSPLIWSLLEDGIRRGLSHQLVGKILKENIHLHLADAKHYLNSSKNAFDTIYLDPMYPRDSKSALNKARMRLLRTVVGDDEDSDDLLVTARQAARKRVVVKRPARAPFLASSEPSFSIQSRSSRFDIYLAVHL